MLVQSIQNVLVKIIRDNLTYYIEIIWDNNMGSIHVLTKYNKILQTTLRISNNCSAYFKKEYTIKQIIVKDITNKNPHIIIPLPKV
jgi:hypothetical protein